MLVQRSPNVKVGNDRGRDRESDADPQRLRDRSIHGHCWRSSVRGYFDRAGAVDRHHFLCRALCHSQLSRLEIAELTCRSVVVVLMELLASAFWRSRSIITSSLSTPAPSSFARSNARYQKHGGCPRLML